MLIAELQRINSHLVWLGTHGMEVGAVSVMMYCFRERELLLNINEMLAGFRHVPELHADRRAARGPAERLPRRGRAPSSTASRASCDEYEDLLTKNQIWLKRTQGVGVLCRRGRARATAWSGRWRAPPASTYDVRKAFPYLGYETYDFDVPTATDGDVYDRYLVRVAEMRESMRIAQQALERISPRGVYDIQDYRIVPPPKDKVYTEMEALIQHFLIYSQGFTVPAGEAYVPVEGPRGEHGFYDRVGRHQPAVAASSCAPPSFYACQALPRMIVGGLIADVIAVIGSTDVVMGDVDR